MADAIVRIQTCRASSFVGDGSGAEGVGEEDTVCSMRRLFDLERVTPREALV